MKIFCYSCGALIDKRKGNVKYCTACRVEVNAEFSKIRNYRVAGERVAARHALEKVQNMHLVNIRLSAPSIDDIVELTLNSGLSYGKQVAKLEGRI